MAYNAQGQWTAEDDKVDSEVNRITSQNSPLMQSAATKGYQAANRRGLMNSSMGVQSAQKAVIDTALPMASQNASQTHQKNMGAQDFSQNKVIQQTELDATAARQDKDIQNQKFMQAAQIDRDKYLANFDRDTQVQMQGLNDQLQTKLAQMNLASNDREKAAAMAAAFENSYAQMYQGIMDNPNIPAAERTKALTHIGALRNSQLALVEQIYSINLDWATPMGTP